MFVGRVQMHCRISQNVVRYKVPDSDLKPELCWALVVEFRESIRPAIPQIIAFLNHGDLNDRTTGADALAKLSEQGKVSNFLTWTLLTYL